MTLHDAFGKVAKANSQRVAVRSNGRELTYAGLDEWSERLAESIKGFLGDAPEPVITLIGLSEYFHVCALGIMKAGKIAAQLKTEQSDPDLMLQLETVGSRLILTTDDYLPTVERLAKRPTAIYLVDRMEFWRLERSVPLLAVFNHDVAFLDFTSGSTGRPKGVVHAHGPNVALASDDGQAYGLEPGDRVGQNRAGMAGYRWALAALLCGATLICRSARESAEHGLVAWINEEKPSVLAVLASSFRYLMTTGERFLSLRIIEVGGEMVDGGDVELYKEKFADACKFVCRYATSEVGLVSRLIYTKDSAIVPGRLPVGYPAPGVEVRILDDDLSELPDGMMGEIAVRSPYMALGYWRDAQLTAAKFKDDDKGRFGLTGDYGYIKEGCLYHAGRKDFQGEVKAKFNKERTPGGI